MYAQSIVEERLEMASVELGFSPTYHSVPEVEEFNRRLERKYEDVYREAQVATAGSQSQAHDFHVYLLQNLQPKLTKDEIRWILGERALSMCDAAYWMTRYYWIKTPRAIQRFTFLPGQKVFFNVTAALEERRLAIELIINKARQHGVSTETAGLALHRVNFGYGVNCVLASASRVQTGRMSQMTFLGYDMMPWWMRSVDSRRVESDQGMLVFGGLKSGISLQHGAQMSAIARGDTVKVYHLSEVASYSDAGSLIEDGLFKCVHAYPDVLGILESTAEGDTGWWHDTYWISKRGFQSGRSRLCALFLPWFVGTDKYPTETWLRGHPVPGDWRPIQETHEMASRAELYVKSNPVLERVLGSGWKLPRHQMWFWEVSFVEHRDKGREKKWFQEMPTDDVESFQGSYESVFGREVIATAYSQRQPDYEVYGIVGQSIEADKEPHPDDVDYTKPRISCRYDSRRGPVYTWELVPMRWKENWKDLTDIQEQGIPNGFLMVFRPPEDGFDYYIGIDSSTGVGDESTVIAVARIPQFAGEPLIQVAEFRSNLVSHVEAYAYVMAIASYYSKFLPNSRVVHREPYVAPEQVMAVGDTVYKDMQKMGYSRFHHMTRMDVAPKRQRKSKSTQIGWFTRSYTRPILVDNFIVAVQNGWYVVNSPWTLWEMAHFEVHYTQRADGGKSKEKMEHSSDSTDDGIFANGIALVCYIEQRSLTHRSRKRSLEGPVDDFSEVEFAPAGMAISPRGHGTLDRPSRDWDLERLL